MGGGRFDPGDWKHYATDVRSYATKATDAIFESRRLHPDLDPKAAKNGMRESCDSPDNPNATAIILALDVTGSMSIVLDALARKGLPTLATELYDRRPVTDPHIMCMGIGDAEAGDEAPLQVTQFEADIRIAKQLELIFLERHGGGNNYESYLLAHYFAAHHTKTDCFTKRGKKGYLFTIGDEEPTPYLRRQDILRVVGDTLEVDKLSQADIMTLVARQWEVFHVIVEEGDYASTQPVRVHSAWTKLLGQRALSLKDHQKLAEVVVFAIQVNEGASSDDVIGSWSGETALVVGHAVRDLAKGKAANGGLVSL